MIEIIDKKFDNILSFKYIFKDKRNSKNEEANKNLY